jgi:glycosyltransferase involved in cell wall biosynthesis
MPLPALLHGCSYNGSHAAGLVIAGSNATHQLLGTLTRKVHAVIALTEFMKRKLLDAGFEGARLHVRANFIPDPGASELDYASRDKRIAFVGQIETIKGVEMCAEAWTLTDDKTWRLSMIGDGKLRESLVSQWRAAENIDWHGKIARSRAIAAMSSSRFLVLPSLWYEGLPLVLLEAMSHGTPAIVPDHGAFPEIVEDGVNGIVFKAGDVFSLRDAFRRATSMSAYEWTRLALGARSRFLERYTSHVAYEKLLEVYSSATEIARIATAPLRT